MDLFNRKVIKPVVIKIPEGFEYFDYDEIIRFEAKGNCTLVYSIRNQKPSKSLCNLLTIEKKFPHPDYLRCHKSHIINLLHIRKVCIKTRQIAMEGDNIVPISVDCLRKIKSMSASC